MSSVVVFHGSVRIHSRYVRMTPYSAAAAGSFSSRASSRSAAFRASSGRSSDSSRSRSSLISACSASPSPSSSWIAFSCWRRKNSRWPFSISDWTCDWIFVPSSRTSSSRFRIVETARSRSSTFTELEQPLLLLRLEAQRRGDEVAERARVLDVRGRELQLLGQVRDEPDHAREEVLDVARQRLDLARLDAARRAAARTRRRDTARLRPAGRAGCARLPGRGSAASRRARGSSCGRSPPCRPRRDRRSRAARRSSFLTVTSASSRSPATTSSMSLIERSCPIASGVIDSGKTTVSFSGSTGSDGRDVGRLDDRLDELVGHERA